MNKLTPREPTPEMVKAAVVDVPLAVDVGHIWRAMHDAAPTVEAEPVAHGFCSAHKQPGGCPLPNVQCGWPKCDVRPITHPAAPQPAALPELSDAEILALATKKFPDWREDIQAAFVLQLARAVIAALKGKR